MGRVKRRARLADSLFKMAAINLFKNAESEEHAFVQQQSTRKVHQAVLRERIPCPHISCAESDVFYEPVNGMYHHFRVIHNIAFTKKHLQESYALRRRRSSKFRNNITENYVKELPKSGITFQIKVVERSVKIL